MSDRTKAIEVTFCGHAPTLRIVFPDGKRKYEIHAGTLTEDPHAVRNWFGQWLEAWVDETADSLHSSYQEQREMDSHEE